MSIECGDAGVLLAGLGDETIGLTFTSPPYLNAREYSQYSNVDEYMATMKGIFEQIFLKTKPSRMCVVNISPVLKERKSRQHQSYRIPLPFYFVGMMEDIGFEFLEDIIWKKPEGATQNRNGGFYTHRQPLAYKPNIVTEYVLVFKKPAPHLLDYYIQNKSLVPDGYERTNVWEISPENKSEHPAAFPVELAEKVILYYSYENDVVLDPFIGSGTTAIAARRNNRKYIGFDIHEEYTEMARERLLTTPIHPSFDSFFTQGEVNLTLCRLG